MTGYEIENLDDYFAVRDRLAKPAWKERYKWVFVDSITEIDMLCFKEISQKSDKYSMWATYKRELGDVIRIFKDLKHYNVVFTCLDSEKSDPEVKGNRLVLADLSSKNTSKSVDAVFDEVFYMARQGDKRVFYTQFTHKYPGKDRSGVLKMIEPADLGYIRDKIFSEVITDDTAE